MTFKNTKTQKAISSLIILAILAPSVAVFVTPKKTEAQFTDFVNAAIGVIGNVFGATSATSNSTGVAVALKNVAREVARQMLMAVARKALASMTKSTVNWINSGFHGAPLFVENPSAFFKDIGKFQVKDFIQVTGYDNLQYPFGKQYALNVINAYKRQFETNATHSLSRVTNDPALLNSLRVDFNTGGWDAFLMNTQYPQNNPIGYDIIASQRLSAKLDGTFKAPAQKVNDALQQGLGFLSPQTCLNNPSYNNGRNEFDRPSFTPPEFNPPANTPLLVPGPNGSLIKNPAMTAFENNYAAQKSAAKTQWGKENTCTQLASTTPGSVVGAQITKSLGTTQTQKELAAALGNSLGAIFDSLISKFMGAGLNALATKVNTPPTDTFTYYGETLDNSNVAGNGDNWTLQEIDLALFKEQISGGTSAAVDINGEPITTYKPGAIEMTKTELEIIDSTGSTNGIPNSNKIGMVQILEKTWPTAKRLDMCIPGPNKGWEKRLDDERDRIINSKFMKETSSEEDLKVKAVNGVMRDLRFAVSSFKDWVNIKMMAPPLGLPDSILFIDAVKETNGNGQLLKELTDKKRSKQTAIARLESIERALIPFTVQPTAGSPEEKALITLRKQYNAITSVIGSEVSIEDLRSQRDLLAEKLQNLLKREFDCVTQRNASQWSQSIDPKIGGILAGAARPYLFGTWINKTIGNVARPGPDGPEGDPLKGTGSKGTESDVFCEVPAHNGYSHGDRIRREQSNKIYPASPPGARDTNNKGDTNYLFTFRNPYGLDDGSPGYTDLPMLKAGPVYGDDTKKYDPVSIDIDCPTIFKATDVDYKHAGEENF